MATWVNHEWFQHICSCEGDIASSGDSNGFNIDVNVLIYPSWITAAKLFIKCYLITLFFLAAVIQLG